MKICDLCFNDEEMQLTVRNESIGIGICEACGKESSIIDADVFSGFFNELFGCFVPSEEGTDVAHLIQKDWNVFVDIDVARKIVAYYLNQSDFSYTIDEKVDYMDDVLDYINVWEQLKQQVMEKSRFFTSLESFDKMRLIQWNMKIPVGTKLYRARVVPPDKEKLCIDEMGCPPAKFTPAGRANPLGIPYLYLCQDEETTFYEVRALYLDKLAVGIFNINRDLEVFDFTKRLSLYIASTMSENLADVIMKFKLIQRISSDLSKPLRRFDTELDYVPTQLICEYCKLNGIDGIRFESSLHEGGHNVVLFDAGSADCVDVKTKEIKYVKIG